MKIERIYERVSRDLVKGTNTIESAEFVVKDDNNAEVGRLSATPYSASLNINVSNNGDIDAGVSRIAVLVGAEIITNEEGGAE